MSNDPLKQAARGIGNALVEGFANAVDDVRRHVVEEATFGRAVTPARPESLAAQYAEMERWLGKGEESPAPGGDPLGRASAEVEAGEVMPPEGRPSNHEERISEAVAYARHQEAGPFGLMEMDNQHSHQMREMEEWLDGREAALGLPEDRQRDEQEIER